MAVFVNVQFINNIKMIRQCKRPCFLYFLNILDKVKHIFGLQYNLGLNIFHQVEYLY